MTTPPKKWRGLIRFTVLTIAFASMFSMLLHTSGVSTEVFARLDPPVPYAPVKFIAPRALDLPVSPFLEAGRRSDGSIDSELMEARFRAAGLTERQAVSIAQRLPLLSTNIIAVADPVFEAALIREATEAVEDMKAAYPKAHATLSSKDPPIDYKPHAGWIDFKVKMVWMSATHKPHDLPPPDKQKMDQAHADLLLVVQEAGLRALRVAPSDLSDAPTLNRLAARIREANQGLQRATGWKGGVLGLGGRIELTVGAPGADSAAGVTVSALDSDRLRITGMPHSLGHEWFHALDFSLARSVMRSPSHDTLSGQLAPFRLIKNRHLASVWKQASHQLEEAAPDWYRARQMESLKSLSTYWITDSEKMAFAFQAHAGKTSHTLALPWKLSEYNEKFPYTYPAPKELENQSQVWVDLFENLAPIYQDSLLPKS